MPFRRLATSFFCAALVIAFAPTSTAGASADDQSTEAIETVDALLGSQTADSTVTSDGDTVVHLVEDGALMDIPADPSEGIVIDHIGGTSVVVVPTDPELSNFERESTTAVAVGDGYASVAQPLEDGDFRMAVVLEDHDAPMSLSYAFDFESGVEPVRRPDGGYDFVDGSGSRVGGIGAPWAVDAAGNAVDASYDFHGNVLTRTVTILDSTVFPVVTNWCMFGKNPNGSCRGSRWIKPVTQCAGWAIIGGVSVYVTGGGTAAIVGVGIASCAASQL